jgi:murein DD-endopeptidase MepM/ murein hydrolase activator NlpD
MSTSNHLKSRFLEYLLANNRPHMDGFKNWLFQPGMLFQAMEKWWGDRGARAAPHEGLDLYSFEDDRGIRKTVDRHIKIPAAFYGAIVKIAPDFLGQSIFIRHEIFNGCGRQLCSAYGHTAPLDFLAIGQEVLAGEIIALISGGPGKKTGIAPHLHITFAWLPAPVDPDQLTWANLGANRTITLVDPSSVLSIDSEMEIVQG